MKRKNATRGPIDWTAVRQHLADASVHVDAATDVSPESARAIMEERARKLARVPETQGDEEMYEVVVFGLGPERYCIETNAGNSTNARFDVQ